MVEPQTGAEHLRAARTLARQAHRLYTAGDRDGAAVLARIGAIHATLAQAAALALPTVVDACGADSWETIEWARAIGVIRDPAPGGDDARPDDHRADTTAGAGA